MQDRQGIGKVFYIIWLYDIHTIVSTILNISGLTSVFCLGLLSAVWRLLANPLYTAQLFAFMTGTYFVSGWIGFLPKYFEVQFNLTASKASIYAGESQALCHRYCMDTECISRSGVCFRSYPPCSELCVDNAGRYVCCQT